MVTFPQAIRELSCLPPSDFVDAADLAANTAHAFVPPASAAYVVFSCTADFYVKYGGDATVPSDTADGSASELNPTMRYIKGQSKISVISATANARVTLAYYGA